MTTTRQKHRILNDAMLDQLRDELRPLIKDAVAELRLHSSQHASKPDAYISRRDAARILGVSVQTVAKLLKDGDLLCSRIGRRVLIREADVATLATSKRGGAA